jgi:membrane protein
MNIAVTKSRVFSLAGILKSSFKELAKNDPLRMAGATAFFTTFALPPILIILLQLLGLLFDRGVIRRQLFIKLSGFIGRDSVHQVVETLIAFRKLADNWFITIAGFAFLLFVATTLFKVIKSSLNQVWRIKVNKRRNLWIGLRTRSHSLVLILMLGVLFLIGLFVEWLQGLIAESITVSDAVAPVYNQVINFIISVLIVTLWFAGVFRFLPDGKPTWKVAITGALLTSILFNTGKLVFRWLMLGYNNVNTVYGTSGSIILIMLFVFYASLILYYGAAFTKLWGAHTGHPIAVLPHAKHYQVNDVEEEND